MRVVDIFKTAGNNLWRNKTRSTLTIVAIFVGATTITLTSGIGDGIKSYLNSQIGGLGASNVLITQKANSSSIQSSDTPQEYDESKVKAQTSSLPNPGAGGGMTSSYLLTDKDIESIKAVKDVVAVNPMLSLTIDYITTGSKRYVIDSRLVTTNAISFDLAAGNYLDMSIQENQVLLPTFYVKALGFSDYKQAVGKNIQISISDQNKNTKTFEAKVVGVVNKSLITSDSLMMNKYMSESTVLYQNNGKADSKKDLYSAAVTEFTSSLSASEIDDLKTRLSDIGYSAKTIKDQQQLVFSIIDALVMVLNMFGVVALVAASFGIINTLYMAVQERTKEIGLMKAVGMSNGKIFALFSIEASLLGVWGSTLGVVVANGLGVIINKVASDSILKDFEGLQLLSFNYGSALAIIGIIVTIAFLAGTLPSRKASKLDPIQALRYE